MRFAYADPPCFGQGKKLYAKHHPAAHLWDEIDAHRALIDRLVAEFPDGWAMSASSPSLQFLLTLCPDDVRVGAWVKPFAIFKPNVGVAFAWEPVIFRGGRKITRKERTQRDWARDWVSENITLRKGLTGAKPPAFCEWVLNVLNVKTGDELVDVFPGTGIMSMVFQERQAKDAFLGAEAERTKE